MSFRRFIFFTASMGLLLSLPARGQNLKLLDSLKRELRSTPRERQFDVLNNIGFEYRYSYPDSTIYYCSRAFELGEKIQVAKNLARPLSFIGLAKANQGDYKAALDFQNRSLEVATRQQDTIQLAHSHNNLGRVFFDEGDLARAYTNFLRAKDLFERTYDKSGLAYVHRSLATLFKAKKDFTKALENSEKALALRMELGDLRAITSAYMELGLVYEEMDSTPLALHQFELADSIATMVNDKITKAELTIGIAEILFLEKRTEEALSMAESVLSVVSENTNQKIFLRASLLIGKCLVATRHFDQALAMLMPVYDNSEKTGNLEFQRDAAALLSTLYGEKGVPVKAKEFTDIHRILHERIQNADLNREIERLQFQLQIEKTEKENVSLKARQVQDEALISRQRFENLLLAVVVVSVAMFAISMWSVSRKRKIVNRKLEEQNLHIISQREEIRAQNEILSRGNRELDKLNLEKDTLMHIVAHDLKSPLNQIYGLVRLMELEGSLNSNHQEYLRLVDESTKGGLDLITDLLDVHALNEDKDSLTFSRFQLDQFLRDKMKSFQAVADAKNITLTVDSKSDFQIMSEPNYLGRILDNLLSNAIKFSPRNSTVAIKGEWLNGLVISVKDAGPGFTESDKKAMFQKFKKLSARPTAGENSNGLGLAIVKTLVERLRGEITLNTSSEGTEFLIRIPAEIAQQISA